MRHIFIGLTLVILVLAPNEAMAGESGWGSLYGYVDWTNDYRFYGMSSSSRQPEPQGGLHWAAPDDFYAGVFVSGVRFKDFRGTSYEMDFYFGRHVHSDNNDLNLELLYSAFPDTAGHPSYAPAGVIFPTYNFFETSAELTHSIGALSLAGKALWSPQYGSNTGTLWGLNGTATYAIEDWLSASANWGHQWVEDGTNRSHWDVGATATWHRQWVLDLRYFGTDIGPSHCYNTNWCRPGLVAKITYQFAIL